MDESTRATGYDLFKLIVAILLLLLFLLLFRRPTPQALTPTSPTALAPAETSATTRAASTRSPSVSPTPAAQGNTGSTATSEAVVNPTASASRDIESAATALPSPTMTIPTDAIPTATVTNLETPPLSPTATPAIESTPTPIEATPSPTAAPSVEATPASGNEPSSTITACEAAASRSRLQTGINATILRRLNFRSSPGIQDNWLRTNLPGTEVEVVGGPECIPHRFGAYLWWQIRLPGGESGWSAEGSIHGTFYFMEPME